MRGAEAAVGRPSGEGLSRDQGMAREPFGTSGSTTLFPESRKNL